MMRRICIYGRYDEKSGKLKLEYRVLLSFVIAQRGFK